MPSIISMKKHFLSQNEFAKIFVRLIEGEGVSTYLKGCDAIKTSQIFPRFFFFDKEA